MIETQYGSLSPKELEDSLSKYLSQQPLGVFPTKVTCLLRATPTHQGNNLIILLHYREPAMPYPRRLFSAVRDGISKLGVAEQYQILLYLIVQGQETGELSLHPPSESLPPKVYLPSPTTTYSEIKPPPRRPKLFWGSVIALGVVGIIYGVSRPCLFSSCELIPQSYQLLEQSKAVLMDSDQYLPQVQEDLEQSLQSLQGVPGWSPHQGEVEALIFKHQQELRGLLTFEEGKALQTKAIALTQFPLDIATCREIEALWGQAITTAQSISRDSIVGPLVTEFLPQWQREQQAIIALRTAQEAANLGEVRSVVANSVHNWRLVKATWQTALSRLKQIPPQSSLASDPQLVQLRLSYQEQLDLVQSKVAQEELSQNWEQEARSQALLAVQMGENNQWVAAANHWRQAIAAIENIPPQTTYSSHQESLLPIWSGYLARSEQFSSIAVNLQQVCVGQFILCSYTLTEEVIKVVFTPIYQQELALLTIPGTTQSSNLGRFFQSIKDQTGVPVEIYNHNQILIITY